jgi:hypothetical protein
MLHFNKLDYFAVPNLPPGWEAPTWLTVELGFFAGRLYFEYNEYDNISQYLGSQEVSRNQGRYSEGMRSPVELRSAEQSEGAPPCHSFTTKPLTFLQEWLSLRRKGQDFVHTPMGYICQAKPLIATHPFFGRLEEDIKGEQTNTDNNVDEIRELRLWED